MYKAMRCRRFAAISLWLMSAASGSGCHQANSAKPKVARFPLRVSPNGRYLVDQADQGFRIQGEAAWSLIANLSLAEANTYLSNRAAKGFNTVSVNLFEHKYAQGGKGRTLTGVPSNREGNLPFVGRQGGGSYDGTWGTANFATPNEAYFRFADAVLELMAKQNMLVFVYPMFLGSRGGNSGWWADLVNDVNTRPVCHELGKYIGQRYKHRQNIVWVIGGDYLPPPGSEGEGRLLSFLEGVKAGGANQLWSGDWSAPSLSTDESTFAAYMDVNGVYSYGVAGHPGVTYVEAEKAYQFSPHRPAYLKETGYENEKWIPGDAASVRMYEYYAILGGATEGGFFGNRDIWKFATGRWWMDPADFGHGRWTAALESNGSVDFSHLGQLLDSFPWYELVPCDFSTKRWISDGQGAAETTEFIVGASTPDGKTLLVYFPPGPKAGRTVRINMESLAGPARGRWFDPTSGSYSDVAQERLANAGSKLFTLPGVNHGGDRDWVLVLRAD